MIFVSDKLLCSDNGKYTIFILDTGELNIYSTDKLFPNLSNLSGSLTDSDVKNKKYKNYGTKGRRNFHENCLKEYRESKKELKKCIQRRHVREPLITTSTKLLQNQLQNQVNICLISVYSCGNNL